MIAGRERHWRVRRRSHRRARGSERALAPAQATVTGPLDEGTSSHQK